ncbi:GntR family transcriptional regulator [Cytobacillus oceanisediminis]|uniref:GntR family transcriptional regulator n=2 Tax=Niallia TaxID=2837506 RepID=A0A941JI16_NIACI|nr:MULTISPECIES: GntR family transcriptional regulator [Bacillaceae]MDU1844925.1 GntR family transcriptional regulator [Niallia nealsonii]MBZ9535407.1 GntR family transcriptional regulator [Cytobacillus oceanisediminis]MCB5236362.1 GntR family transcriptional regulator [Niallia circulans]MED3791413.1 GntR family transcriptional regulator [Niallia alba]NMO79799.1 GntR family transcriptional regulator [Niallia alba]
MNTSFNDSKPIFLQIKELIEDQIVNDQLKGNEQIPSTTQLVNFYKINHLTISKGINLLVENGIIYKKRGVGMFVAEGAKEKLLTQRKEQFLDQYLLPMIQEAKKLGISEEDISKMINQLKGSE